MELRRYGRITRERRHAVQALVDTYPIPARRAYLTRVERRTAYLSLHHARWLVGCGLVVEDTYGHYRLSAAGIRFARALGFELPDGANPAVCREWDCERRAIINGYCRVHGMRS